MDFHKEIFEGLNIEFSCKESEQVFRSMKYYISTKGRYFIDERDFFNFDASAKFENFLKNVAETKKLQMVKFPIKTFNKPAMNYIKMYSKFGNNSLPGIAYVECEFWEERIVFENFSENSFITIINKIA